MVFNFRSFTGLRTRWERTTGGASQISSPCHWRNGWQPFMGFNCFHSSVPHQWGQFPLWYNFLLQKINWKTRWYVKEMVYSNEASCSLHRSFTMGDYREPLLPRKHVTLYLGEGSACWGEGRDAPFPPQLGGRGGREVVAAVLRAPMHWQGGKGTGRTTLSWEANSYNHITIRNNEMYHLFSLNSPNLVSVNWTTEKKCKPNWGQHCKTL